MDYNNNDFNNNSNNFSTYGQPDGQQYGQPSMQQMPPLQPQPPKKKKGRTAAVIAGIMAVVIIGGASGFGGAYLGNSLTQRDTTVPTQTSAADTTTPDDKDNSSTVTTQEYIRPSTQISDSLTELDNMIDSNSSTEYNIKDLYKAVSDTIVVVNNYQYVSSNYYGGYTASADGSNGGDITLYGTGSGIVITTDGYIITNAHVVNGAAKVSVTIADYNDPDTRNEYDAVVVGSDSSTDVAVLKVTRDESFKAAALGDSDTCVVGDQVCAIGNPSRLEKTITTGIISGLNRYYDTTNNYELSSIQTDTAINPGNSGGALFDMYGNVIGIVNSKIVSTYAENLGFAITINEAKPVISDLINFGYVTGRPILGVTTLALNEYTAYLYGFDTTGLLITAINEGAPINKSDLQVGDIVTKVNGTAVATVSDVQNVISGMKAGDTVQLTVVRTTDSGRQTKSETLTIDAELDENRG